MKRIKKKLWKEYFDDVVCGKKKYELRLNDFDIEEGDILVLEEWDKDLKQYTGHTVEKTVTSIGRFKIEDLSRYWSKEEINEKGLQILSIE